MGTFSFHLVVFIILSVEDKLSWSPAIDLKTYSASPAAQLSIVTFVINQILKQVEPAPSHVTQNEKKMTQSWQLKPL